jgi:hypothetical protein
MRTCGPAHNLDDSEFDEWNETFLADEDADATKEQATILASCNFNV